MTRPKWTTLATAFAVSLLTTVSCEENQDSKPLNPSSTTRSAKPNNQTSGRISDYTFDGKEGNPISISTATSWVANYREKNPQGAGSHFFGAVAVRNILAQSSCMGIRIYYSLDDSDKQELLLVGADGNGNDFLPRSGVKGRSSFADLESDASEAVSSSDGASIVEEISERWISNYGSRSSAGLTAHFFGSKIVNQILREDGCIGIRMYYALNESDVQQVLLIGVNARGENILPTSQDAGRVAGDPPIIGDGSYPCPSYCSGH